MKQLPYEDVLASVEAAALNDVGNLTCDRIEALTGGHGMVNMALYAITNVIAEELLRGESVAISFANTRHLPMEDVMRKAIDAAKACGTDAANAALLTAVIMYLAGSPAQVGIPAGNRKLGATARMLAGVDRCGVAAVPTSKMNSKVSGFPAVLALYQAAWEGRLTDVRGNKIPPFIGGALYGHSALGEDYVWPQVAENGARIATQAMLDSMYGVGVGGNKFQAAVLGAAAVLEIIHPDAEVPEGYGTYGRTSSAYLVGKTAAETAGLPKMLHLRVTGQEFDTAQVVGDIGLILKDVGGPSVVGMMAFVEVFSAFSERLCGGSGGPHNSALGHMTCYTVCAMKALADGMSPDEIGRRIVEDRASDTVYPESALVSIYAMSKKASGLADGPVTKLLVKATLPYVIQAIAEKTRLTYDATNAGKAFGDVVRDLDNDRIRQVELNTTRWWKKVSGDDVEIHFLRIECAARRTDSKPVKKYLAFDPRFDIEIRVNDRTAVLEHVLDRVIPACCTGENQDDAWAISKAAPALSDICLAGCNILNLVIPAATVVVMGCMTPTEAAAEAEANARVTAGIPGGKAAARAVAEMATVIAEIFAR